MPKDLGPMPTPHRWRASSFGFGGDDYVVFAMPVTQSSLSAAEQEVARLIVDGRTNLEIARERRTSARTVANQVAKLFRKLGIDRRAELVALMTTGARPERAGMHDERARSR